MYSELLLIGLIVETIFLCYRETRLLARLPDKSEAHDRGSGVPQGERFHSIVENAVEGIFQSTPDGRYMHVNPALARLYGYDTASDLKDNLHNIAKDLYVAPNRRSEFQKLLQTQDFVRDFESQVYRKDGSVIWINPTC